ncbi:hypothetical protein BDB00DRAFT_106554 [Zychaea mexicana]|uniref:uncharacterized protein n=1 Tax=Zychaea mexicana TaxID=64656 RepID=UPI0022FDFE3C|nr:uncharacterized protein BDB00DRAFT_106554 [Zychaea mexicana]KAI9484926.1 hypothetical protein BDB00DRAFT_106554 [Zychaea mexicana]
MPLVLPEVIDRNHIRSFTHRSNFYTGCTATGKATISVPRRVGNMRYLVEGNRCRTTSLRGPSLFVRRSHLCSLTWGIVWTKCSNKLSITTSLTAVDSTGLANKLARHSLLFIFYPLLKLRTRHLKLNRTNCGVWLRLLGNLLAENSDCVVNK